MADADLPLTDVAQAIADGQAVDWIAVEGAVGHDSARDLVRYLGVVHEIVAWHQRVTSVTEPSASVLDELREDSMSASVAAALVPISGAHEPLASWGHLRVIEPVGHGAFGEVYRARDTRLDRDVALKLLRRRESRRTRGSSVVDEGRLLARVRHPNVITVHGADRIGDHVGLWMEFIDGQTLEQELHARGPFNAEEVTRIGIDICRALAAVHRAGLLHRDVKAQNVMRDRDGRIVLMDFGAGREDVEDADDAWRDFAGTPLYLAPEIFQHRAATIQSDVYSLGVLLYRLATGSYPISARTLPDVRAAHERGEGVSLGKARPDLPTPFVDVIQRALAPNPDDRYASANAMEAALEQLVSPSSARTPLWKRSSTWATVTALLIAVVAGAFAWRQLGPTPSDQDSGGRLRVARRGTWTTKAHMLKPRRDAAGGVIEGKVYVVGGLESPSGTTTGSGEVYDPAQDAWKTIAPEPIARANAVGGVINGKLYLVGGAIGGDSRTGTTNALDAYDPATNTWAMKSPMPTARAQMAVGVINNRLYVAGGAGPQPAAQLFAALEVYDPATDRWTTETPMPRARTATAAGVVDGILYVGGDNSYAADGVTRTFVTTLEAYSPITHQWSAKASMPVERHGSGSDVMDGVLYVVGGSDSSGVSLNSVEGYDPTSDTWTTMRPMPTAREGPVVAVVNHTIYAAGGSNPDLDDSAAATMEALSTVTPRQVLTSIAVSPAAPVISVGQTQQLTATGVFDDGTARILTRDEGVWTTIAPIPAGRSGMSAITIDSVVYVLGGAESSSVEAYDPATHSWTKATPMPSDRRISEAATIDSKLYVVGGWGGGSCCPNNNLWVYDPHTSEWTARAPLPIRSSCGAAGAIAGKLYVTTACNGYSEIRPFSFFHVYDPLTNAWTRLPDVPHLHSYPVAGVINGKLYVAGGSGSSALGGSDLDVYDPATNTWVARAPMPTARCLAAGAVLDGMLYVAGGASGTRKLSVVEAYDPVTDSWTSRSPLPIARSHAAGAVVNGTLYVAGGNGEARGLASMEVYDPRELAWTISNPSVATISATGFLTASGTPGSTTVTVTSGGVTGRATLRVIRSITPAR